MNKPNGYDEAQVGGEFTPVEIGGHYLIIKNVSEMASKNGDEMIVVSFDFASNDKQPGYFMNAFRNDIRPDKKWPHQATQYIMVKDYQDKTKTSKNFKTFCECFKASNNCDIKWGVADWGKQFVNKFIGGVFGLVENEYNGKRYKKPELRWFCKTDAVANATVPDEKLLKTYTAPAPAGIPVGDDFFSVPSNVPDFVPFN